MLDAPQQPIVSLNAVEALRRDIAPYFHVYDTMLDAPEPGQVRFRGTFLQDSAECFDDLRQHFERYGFTPIIRQEKDQLHLIGLPGVYRDTPNRTWINLLLLAATILSTLSVGAIYDLDSLSDLSFATLLSGWPFSLSIMLILGAHEMGHYIAARIHKVPVTEPFFIPVPYPLSIIGTLGAFIRLKGPVNNRRALLDVGAAGPLAGLLFALPILYIGLSTSELGPLPVSGGYILEGNSLIYAGMKYAIFGTLLPAGGIDVQLNQVAWAGWVGLLVTGLNLIPVGQLDGGHVAYVLFGEKARNLFIPVIVMLAAFVILFQATTWVLWIGLLLFFGRRYAVPLDDVTPLDRPRRIVAWFTLAMFVLVFTPVPLQVVAFVFGI